MHCPSLYEQYKLGQCICVLSFVSCIGAHILIEILQGGSLFSGRGHFCGRRFNFSCTYSIM